MAGALPPDVDTKPARAPSLVVLLALCLWATPSYGAEHISAAIIRGTAAVTLEVEAPVLRALPPPGERTHDVWVVPEGEPLRRAKGAVKWQLAPVGDDGIEVGGRRFAAPLHLVGSGELRVAGVRYAGAIHLHRDGPRLLVVNRLPIDTYVLGVLMGEMPLSWPIEALAAQAVAARTYAFYQKLNAPKGRHYDVEATVLSQVYKGLDIPEDSPARRAVEKTRGEVMIYRRAPINAFFHSCCAGRTEAAGEIWSKDLPYLTSVSCGFDTHCSKASWEKRVPLATLARKLEAPGLRDIRIVERTATGRVKTLELRTGAKKRPPRRIRVVDFRRALGYESAPGNFFELALEGRGKDRSVKISGKGSGHGVGLCQWGARGMAKAGRTHAEILSHYYPGAQLKRAW